MDNPYYVSFEHPLVDKAKNLWNKYGGGTDHERHILRQLMDLNINARTFNLDTHMWIRNCKNISCLILQKHGSSQRESLSTWFLQRKEYTDEAQIYRSFVSSLNEKDKRSMKLGLESIEKHWDNWFPTQPCPILSFLLSKFP